MEIHRTPRLKGSLRRLVRPSISHTCLKTVYNSKCICKCASRITLSKNLYISIWLALRRLNRWDPTVRTIGPKRSPETRMMFGPSGEKFRGLLQQFDSMNRVTETPSFSLLPLPDYPSLLLRAEVCNRSTCSSLS